jgi:hypothetical protein
MNFDINVDVKPAGVKLNIWADHVGVIGNPRIGVVKPTLPEALRELANIIEGHANERHL